MHPHPSPGATLQIAEVFRRFAGAYRHTHALGVAAGRVLGDLERCRTAALGGHLYRCHDCGRDVPLFNSCLNRHCPTCQGPAQYRWIEERQRRLLNTPYFHVVFTLPAILRAVVSAQRRVLLDLLFRAASQTLRAFAADPKWLGAQAGFTLVLHTWTRELLFHPHLHAIVTGGGLSPAGTKWVGVPNHEFLFPVSAVSKVFRGKFLEGLIELSRAGKLDLTEPESRKLVRQAKKHDWVVYAKRPFGGPTQIVRYLGRYTHRVGISSSRLLSVTDHRIVFRTRGEHTCSLTPEEFLRRFLLHVLPERFFKIRHYGLLAPANVNTRLVRAQELLGPPPAEAEPIGELSEPHAIHPTAADTTPLGATHEANAVDRAAPICPHCGGRLRPLSPRRLHRPSEPPPPDP
ncbi:MAG: IS91 family transposase [Burkholderiales bacterium]